MTEDHLQRTTALEVKVDRIERKQDAQSESLQRIENHLSRQSGAVRMGLWVLSGLGALGLAVLSLFKGT